jgi:hypothetical protein
MQSNLNSLIAAASAAARSGARTTGGDFLQRLPELVLEADARFVPVKLDGLLDDGRHALVTQGCCRWFLPPPGPRSSLRHICRLVAILGPAVMPRLKVRSRGQSGY